MAESFFGCLVVWLFGRLVVWLLGRWVVGPFGRSVDQSLGRWVVGSIDSSVAGPVFVGGGDAGVLSAIGEAVQYPRPANSIQPPSKFPLRF